MMNPPTKKPRHRGFFGFILDILSRLLNQVMRDEVTIYSADLAFWLPKLILPNPNLDFRAAYHLGVAKSAAIGVGLQNISPLVAKGNGYRAPYCRNKFAISGEVETTL